MSATQSLDVPSVIPALTCPQCGLHMRLALVSPAPPSMWVETMLFECRCGCDSTAERRDLLADRERLSVIGRELPEGGVSGTPTNNGEPPRAGPA